MRSETGRSGVSRRSGRDRGANGVRRMSIFVRLMAARWQSTGSLVIPVIRYSFGKVARLVSDRALFRVMGNESLAETQKARVLDRAIDSLRRAFPPERGIDLTEANSPDRPGREDQLVVRTPAGAVAEFAIEIKSTTRGSAAVITQLP